MRFTERELTAAVHGAAKAVLAAQQRDIRRGRVDVEAVWTSMDRYQRFQLLNLVGDQVLSALVALPDVDVVPGTRPAFSDAQIVDAVEQTLGEEGGRLRRKAVVATRAALVRTALEHVPPRADPDALTVPDYL
jgi:hypothetical protein